LETRLLEIDLFQSRQALLQREDYKNNTPKTISSILPSHFAAMATAQRFIISVLLILTVVFTLLAQTSEAAKGPKITHKVGTLELDWW
jgi:hypothetical protein